MVLKGGLIVTEKKGEPKTHIIALACQTIDEDKQLALTCDDTFDDLANRDGQISHKVLCLKDCSKAGDVFGVGMYSGDSKVCRAMMHSGS